MANTRRIGARYTKKARSKSARSRANASELARIEDLLGEDFESISEARKALKKETGAAPYKQSYTVKELSSKRNRRVSDFVADVDKRTDEIDSLKHPDDFWAAEIYGHGTFDVYGSIEQLSKKLASYRGLQEEHPEKALRNIKIIRVQGAQGLKDYKAQKKLQVERSWQKSRAKHKLDRTRQKRQAKKLEASQAKSKAQAKRIRELERQLRKAKAKKH